MNDKLTRAQQAALQKLAIGERKSAYGLRASIATCEALQRLGYLREHGGLGDTWTPRTSIKWERIK